MTTNLNVVDPAFIPQEFTQGNRPIVVAVVGFGTFFLLLGLLVLANIVDGSIRDPARAEELTGLHVAAAYPLVSDAENASLPAERIFDMLDAQLLRTVQLSVMRSADTARSLSRYAQAPSDAASDTKALATQEPPTLILVASTQAVEGKTFVARRLVRSLRRPDSSMLFLAPHSVGDLDGNVRTASYPHDAPLEMYDDLLDLFSTPAATDVDTVVMELPPLKSNPLPIRLIQQSSAVVIVARADRPWARTDAEALDALRVSTEVEPALVLNGVDLESIEDMLGTIPDERRDLSGWLNRASRLEFKRPLPFATKSDRYAS
jgi:Mrp family chromosome partitioning ATPase